MTVLIADLWLVVRWRQNAIEACLPAPALKAIYRLEHSSNSISIPSSVFPEQNANVDYAKCQLIGSH